MSIPLLEDDLRDSGHSPQDGVEPTDLVAAETGEPEAGNEDEYADVIDMVAALRMLPPYSDEYSRQRERIVLRCCPLADRVARHFDRRGESLEDLVQVARVGLIQAINRFDPDRGSRFVSFALPTIMGELRRYFRDYGWKVHVPRKIRDRQRDISSATALLTSLLRRSPTIQELADELDIERSEVVDSMLAAKAYQPQSLDISVADGEENTQTVGESIGEWDPGFDRVNVRESVKSLLAVLPARERKVLYLRYFGSMTQRQIADSIGVSQMHVSRILDRTLGDLRSRVSWC